MLETIGKFCLATAFIASSVAGCDRGVEQVGGRNNHEPVTFTRDIAPLVYRHCSDCHRPGEAAPFSLLTYEDVRDRAEQIAEVTQTRFMPPWLPHPGYGDFVRSRRLTDKQIDTIQSWVAVGAPQGEAADLPSQPAWADGWQLGEPDLVLESPPYTLEAGGDDVFRNFVVAVPLTEPRWVQSIELRAENPQVTHHARLGVDSTSESVRRDAEDEEAGYEGMAWGQDPDGQLVSWVPGKLANAGTSDSAWRLHGETNLVLHTHMQPSGRPETIRFRIGLHFADESPQCRPVILRIGSQDIDIPPDVNEHTVYSEYELPIDVQVHFIFPHAHSLCRKIKMFATLPDGSEEWLIRIDKFDENWHDEYRYVKPLILPRGSVLHSEFVYDNSADNIRNPHNPPRRIVYGSNADDEMADAYLQVTAVDADQREVLLEDYRQQDFRWRIVGYRKTLEAKPNDVWSLDGLAACYFGQDRPKQAVEILEKRLELKPDTVHVLVSLGFAYSAVGDHGRAEKDHQRAVELDAEYPTAWHGLGRALAAQKQLDKATQALRRAVQLAPGLTAAYLDLADSLIQQGELEEAADACESAIRVRPESSKSYMKLAEIRGKQRQYKECLQLLHRARGFAPYMHPPQVMLALFYYQNGDQQQARRLLQVARADMPKHPVPSLFLGQWAVRERDLQSARELLEKARSLPCPENWPASHRSRFLTLVHGERLQLAQQLQDLELAFSAVDDWLELDPGNQQLRNLKARLLTESGD